jgi:hypothetical protein
MIGRQRMNSKVFVETIGLSYHITLQKIRGLMLCACVTASERRAALCGRTMVVAPEAMKLGAL